MVCQLHKRIEQRKAPVIYYGCFSLSKVPVVRSPRRVFRFASLLTCSPLKSVF